MPQSCCPPQPTNCKPGSNQQTVCLLLKPDGNSKIRATRTITVAEDCTETFEYEAQVDSYNPLTGYSRADEIPCGDGANIPFAPLGGGGGGGDATAANQVLEIAQLTAINAGIPAGLGSLADAASMPVAFSTEAKAVQQSISTSVSNSNANLTNIAAQLPTSVGQKAMTASLAVVIASNQSPLTVISQAVYIQVDATRPANATPYTANDAIGPTSAILSFASFGAAADNMLLTSAELRIDVAAVPSGMAGFRLHLYSASPTAIADNAAWDLVSGDRATYLGFVDFATPTDLGSTLYTSLTQINKHIKLGATTLYGVLVTLGAFTPAGNSEVYKVSLGAVKL